ncbi:MAG: type II toxin-antitoxin system VapC family toxin [Cyanobacteria bacterium P01_F01_bin.143]
MIYLLDTCVVSDFVSGDKFTLNKIRQKTPDDLSVSTLTVMEIYYGLKLNPAKARKIQPIIEQFLDRINIIDFTNKEAETTALIHSVLKKAGTPIGAYDLLIGATALANDLTLVTSNTREFKRIANLSLENWREDD